MIELRGDITRVLNDEILDNIKKAPKPTKVAEVLAVTRNIPGIAVTFEEIAEIINISDPGRDEKSSPSDYDVKEIRKHPELLVENLPNVTYVRYVQPKKGV
jgi:hypothetical protein